MPKFFLIFIGPPASGKGTQADRLGVEFKLAVVSPGELLRHERDAGTAIGAVAREKLDKGELVPDEIVEELLDRSLKRKEAARGAIFDGYPRNAQQLGLLLNRFKKALDPRDKVCAIEIKVGDGEVKERISGRRACDCGASYHLRYQPPKKNGICDQCGKKLYVRTDDKPAVVAARLEDYHRQSQPIIDHFKRQGILIEIDGEQDIEKVYKDIIKELARKGIFMEK
ncbi:MAG: nucleoside monophosphate kinase [Planctomycetes bacterium]|jgi:adenylate kinase|nr:nucleoside monophosphate kinase [Planctomycetota bacterium]